MQDVPHEVVTDQPCWAIASFASWRGGSLKCRSGSPRLGHPGGRREPAAAEVLGQASRVLEGIAGNLLAHLPRHRQEPIDLAGVETFVTAAFKDDPPACTVVEEVFLAHHAGLAKVAGTSGFPGHHNAADLKGRGGPPGEQVHHVRLGTAHNVDISSLFPSPAGSPADSVPAQAVSRLTSNSRPPRPCHPALIWPWVSDCRACV